MNIILLTTTVNVHNKRFLREIDPLERIQSYTKSVSQWLTKTNLKIVVVENSGYIFPEWDEYKEIYKDRFEIISFRESELEQARYLEHDVSKGASEIFAIEYAYLNSKWISSHSDFIIKITGRFFIPGLESFLENLDIDKYDVFSQNDIDECQMVGVKYSYFYNVFFPKLINKNGQYDPHVENIYRERINNFPIERILRCPQFDIELTLGGGGPKKYYYI